MEFASFNIVNNHFGAEHSKDSSVFLHNLKKKKTKNLIKKKSRNLKMEDSLSADPFHENFAIFYYRVQSNLKISSYEVNT